NSGIEPGQVKKCSTQPVPRTGSFLSLALVYHAHSVEEQPELLDVVDRSVQTDSHRKEFAKMGLKIAEWYIEKGRVEGEQKGALAMARIPRLPTYPPSCSFKSLITST